jgi:hypothetical protein
MLRHKDMFGPRKCGEKGATKHLCDLLATGWGFKFYRMLNEKGEYYFKSKR